MLNDDRQRRDVIVLGASAGGVPTLMGLFAKLAVVSEARIAAVLHRSPVYEGRLPGVLGRHSTVPVVEPHNGEVWEPGRIYIAPRDQHMVVDVEGCFRLERGPKQHHTRPALDPLFISVGRVFGARTVGVVLTGMGADGVSGLIAISASGGISLVQSPLEASHPSMPRNAIAHDHVAAALPVGEMPRVFAALYDGFPVETGAERTLV